MKDPVLRLMEVERWWKESSWEAHLAAVCLPACLPWKSDDREERISADEEKWTIPTAADKDSWSGEGSVREWQRCKTRRREGRKVLVTTATLGMENGIFFLDLRFGHPSRWKWCHYKVRVESFSYGLRSKTPSVWSRLVRFNRSYTSFTAWCPATSRPFYPGVTLLLFQS